MLRTSLIVILSIYLAQSHYYVAVQAHPEWTYTLDDGFPIGKNLFGSIAGVDVDKDNNVIIFHRGSNTWDLDSFDIRGVYQKRRDLPISEETVITINPKEKRIIRAWGKDRFYLPHGLSLDLTGEFVWLTDVALHQVFKYPINGSTELLVLGEAFIPGSDDGHFCKPTSVADTGEFVFVADGYCNSRVAMFSADGRYISEFGQSSDAAYLSSGGRASLQPVFNIPHKLTYAKEAKMLCVADRENGRIQCFSFNPKRNVEGKGLILSQTIEPKFTIADPAFNGLLFSLDYCPIRGGVIVAVSGERKYGDIDKPALGFVYNVTTGQQISRFSPSNGQNFGMAHDLAVTGNDAESLFVGDIAPVNLWRFSRPVPKSKVFGTAEITKLAGEGLDRAMSMLKEKEEGYSIVWYAFLILLVGVILFFINRTRRFVKAHNAASNSFAALYSNTYPASINSLFGNRPTPYRRGSNGLRSTIFSRRAFFNLFDRSHQQQNDFSRIPLEDSDNSEDDKSDSDIEEFNINQANPSVKINV